MGALPKIPMRGCRDAEADLTEPISSEQAMELIRARQAVHCGCGAKQLPRG